MDKIAYGPVDKSNSAEIEQIAKIHASTPLNWDPSFDVSTAQIEKWNKLFQEIKDRDTVLFLVAKKNISQVIGFHWLNLKSENNAFYAQIDSLWVNENYRRQGIGQHLKCEGEKWAKSKGAKFIKTGVFYQNKKMLEFNLKQGFKALHVEMIKEL